MNTDNRLYNDMLTTRKLEPEFALRKIAFSHPVFGNFNAVGKVIKKDTLVRDWLDYIRVSDAYYGTEGQNNYFDTLQEFSWKYITGGTNDADRFELLYQKYLHIKDFNVNDKLVIPSSLNTGYTTYRIFDENGLKTIKSCIFGIACLQTVAIVQGSNSNAVTQQELEKALRLEPSNVFEVKTLL